MVTESGVNILLVDDQPENLLALEAILEELGANLIKAVSGEEALRCLLYQDFAVILLDVQMPDLDGFEVATLIRQRQRSRETPIIFLTAFSTSEQFMFKGYALGAVDYLMKPLAAPILQAKITVFIDLFKKTEALKQKTEALKQKTHMLQQQTERLVALNAELQHSEERFRLLSDCSPLGVFVTNPDGQCVYTNPRFLTVCDSKSNWQADQTWLQAVHAADLADAETSWAAYLQDAQEYSQEFRFQLEDGSIRWVHIRSTRMLSKQGKFLGHVGTLEDVTGRRQAEAAQAQITREQLARQEAEAANRMKDEFIAILSHELRTPLNSMLGWSRLLRHRKCDETTTARAIETIERNAISQAKLIEDILDVSQIVRGKLQLTCLPTNLRPIIQAALETVQPLADAKEIALKAHFTESSACQVMGDSVRLQQVIWNLLTNAVKFTPEQGVVEVRLSVVENLSHFETDCKTNCEPELPIPQSYAQIQVSDTGIGISPEFLPHVFDRFRQADSTTTRTHGGLGLGLAIVRYLVEQHQGIVKVESPGVGQGTTFTLKFPLLQMDRQESKGNDTNQLLILPATLPLDHMQVFIVDDDEDTLGFLSFLLQNQGAVVTTATSGVETLSKLVSLQPAILLCDISMPDMDGYTLMHRIRTQLPEPQAHIPAIALTAHAGLSIKEQALAAGFQKHLPKPIEPETLIQEILQLVTTSNELMSGVGC
jgi:PAS domain S-box-containing protein